MLIESIYALIKDKKLYYALFYIVFISSTIALPISKKKILGIIYDKETKERVVHAHIQIKGSSIGTNSGLDGSFTLTAEENKKITLIISCTSYKEEKIDVEPKSNEDEIETEIYLTPVSYNVKEVIINAKMDKESEGVSIYNEKQAINTINSISAAVIQTSPDLTVANVIQRVSGVSIERNNNGDGQYAIIRGMDKRYNYTLLDGIKVPSPDDKNRYVPLDIFPSDLLSRLEVIKVPTPSMEGDAIGGIANMIMKNAPDDFYFNISLAGGYSKINFDRDFLGVQSSLINSESPRERYGINYKAVPTDFPSRTANPIKKSFVPNIQVNLSIGNRFLEDKSLGIILVGSYQSNYRGSNSTFFSSDVDRATNAPSLHTIESREYYAQQKRSGFHLKSDYSLNGKNSFEINGTYAKLILDEVRIASDTNLVLGRVGPGTGRIRESVRIKEEIQTIYNSAFIGTHELFPNSKIEWKYSCSVAEKTEPDRSQISYTTGISKDIYGNYVHTPNYLSQDSYRRWTHNSDKDNTAKIDLTYLIFINDLEVEPRAGLMYRSKKRSNFFDKYTLRPDTSPQVYDGDASKNSFFVFNPFGTSQDALNYDSHENVLAYYAQLKIQYSNLIAVGGIRSERTEFGWESKAPEEVLGKIGLLKYNCYLPSFSVKYMPNEKQNIKISYYASISRPGFYEVIPYIIENEDYTEKGNPYLKYVQSDNFDFRYEYFPSSIEQLLAGFFYKKIVDPIEYTLQESGTNLYLIPANLGTAYNFGFELDVTKYFNKIGIKANYTYTNSSITTPKEVRYRDASGSLTQRIEDQTRPLQGQSAHIANLTLLYKDFDIGLTGQISLSYTGRRIVSVSYFKDNDYWQVGALQTDLSLEKTISKDIILFLKTNNLFDVPYIVEIPRTYKSSGDSIPLQKEGENILIRKDFYGQSFLFGIRYKL